MTPHVHADELPSARAGAAFRRHGRRPLRFVAILAFWFALLAVLLVVLELLLVPVINGVLDRSVKDQVVRIDDVELRPWVGAYAVEGLTVRERRADGSAAGGVPLLAIRRVDAAIDWRALFDGAFVGALTLHTPSVHVVVEQSGKSSGEKNGEKNREKGDRVHAPDVDVAQAIADLVPMRLNRVVVHDGDAALITEVTLPAGTTRALDLRIHHIEVVAENLTNSAAVSRSLFGSVVATATAEGYGDIDVRGRLQPAASTPTFDLDASLRHLPLAQLSDWSLAFGGFTFTAGTLDLFAEVAAKGGAFTGYVKPLGHDVETRAREQDLGGAVIAAVVEQVAEMLENRETHRAGSKIEVSGRLQAPRVHVVGAIFTTLENALIRGLRPIVDGDVDLTDIETPAEDGGKASPP